MQQTVKHAECNDEILEQYEKYFSSLPAKEQAVLDIAMHGFLAMLHTQSKDSKQPIKLYVPIVLGITEPNDETKQVSIAIALPEDTNLIPRCVTPSMLLAFYETMKMSVDAMNNVAESLQAHAKKQN